MIQRLYLAGPMRRRPLWNFPAFMEAAKTLRERGHEVFNPAEQDIADGFDPAAHDPYAATMDKCLSEYMAADLPAVCRADAVVLLPDWKYSEGAVLEHFVARYLGKPTYDYRMPVSAESPLAPCLPEPWEVAFFTVRGIMAEGLKKHPSESWRFEREDNHINKALRHAITHKLIRDGDSPADGETHISNALCRLSMAVARRM